MTKRPKILLGIAVAGLVALAPACAPRPHKGPQDLAGEHYIQGVRYYNRGNVARAVNEWKKTVELDPQHADAQFSLGLAYEQAGAFFREDKKLRESRMAYRTAINYYKKAARLTPADHAVHNNMANVHYALGDYGKAAEEYRKALQLKPGEPDYHYNLANAYSKMGMTKKAVEHYLKTLEIDPNYFDAYYNLANLYEKLGQNEEAIRYYREYADRENRPGESEWVEKAWQKIYRLRGGRYY